MAGKPNGGGKTKYAPEVKRGVMDAMSAGEGPDEVAERFGVNANTMRVWYFQLKKEGRITPTRPADVPKINRIQPLDSPFLGMGAKIEEKEVKRVPGVEKQNLKKDRDRWDSTGFIPMGKPYPPPMVSTELPERSIVDIEQIAATLRGCRLVETYSLDEGFLMVFLDAQKMDAEGRLRALRISNTGSLAILAPEGTEKEDAAIGGDTI